MDKNQIQKLLERYLIGDCTLEEEQKIHRWYYRLRKKDEVNLSEEEKILLEQKLWDNIRQELEAETDFPIKERRIIKLSHALKWAVAAVFLLTLGFGWYYQQKDVPHLREQEQAVASSSTVSSLNDGNTPLEVDLSDGSRITLLPGSSLTYPSDFVGEKRIVTLAGDAFFNIASRPGQPFLVYHGNLITQVLGTQFWIRTDQKNKTQEVEVVSGKVSVFENVNELDSRDEDSVKSTNGVLLTPNQRVTYYLEKGYLLTSVAHEPIPLQVHDTSEMRFDNIELTQIATKLFQKYGIEIILSNDSLGKCTFTGDLNGLLLYDALELVCKSIGADYEIKGTRILIDGKGCD